MEILRLFDLLEFQKNSFPKDDAIASKIKGDWKKFSINDVIEISDQLSIALIKLGISNNDKVAIISENRPEWNFIDYAIQQIGAISVPIYPTVTEEDFKFIFTNAEVKIIFVSNSELYERALKASKDLPLIIEIITFNKIPEAKN